MRLKLILAAMLCLTALSFATVTMTANAAHNHSPTKGMKTTSDWPGSAGTCAADYFPAPVQYTAKAAPAKAAEPAKAQPVVKQEKRSGKPPIGMYLYDSRVPENHMNKPGVRIVKP